MENTNQYLSDQPVSNPNTEDKLGYSSFSQAIANAIIAIPPGKGAVVAINGQWGSGKTSAINFIKYFLGKISENDRPIPVDFNPWWLSGEEQLLRGFFDALKSAFGKGKGFDDVVDIMSIFCVGISKVPGVGGLEEVGGLLKKFTDSGKSLQNLKAEIEDKLLSIGKKIVVFVDDVDRLTPQETLQVFKVIKAIGDFKNVIYVLSFDRAIVLKSLSDIHKEFGENYLEKIVQMQFELPIPDSDGLLEMLFPELNRILGNTPQEKFDSRRWQNSFYYLSSLIKTPRDIKRLCNALSVTYPIVAGEVNSVDFFVLEFLKIFRPLLYGIIRDNLKEFVGTAVSNRYVGEDWKKFHENWFNQLTYSDKSNLVEVVKEIFPKASAVWGTTYYNSLNEWAIESRVCHPDKAEIYFRLAINQERISNKEWDDLLQKISNREDFSSVLIEYSNIKTRKGGTRVKELLEQIWGRSENLSVDIAIKIATILINVGDFILKPEDKWPGFWRVDSEAALRISIYRCLKRDETNRKVNFIKAVSEAKSIYTPMVILAWLTEKNEVAFTKEEIDKIHKVLFERTQKKIQKDGLTNLNNIPYIFGTLVPWGYEKEVKEWAELCLKSSKETFSFLKQFEHESHSQNMGEAAFKIHYRLQPKWLEPYVDPKKIAEIVKMEINSNEFNDFEKRAGNTFLKEWEFVEKGTPLGDMDTFED